jgi:hypothetical protein
MKILIIGQAPPAVIQELPYDTTLLYVMFSWVGIDKIKSQELFEFESMSNVFPGHGVKGHLKPTKDVMQEHYKNTLKGKIEKADKVLILGNVAKEALLEYGIYNLKQTKNILCLIHPSKRNYSKIMNSKNEIIKSLNHFLHEGNF